MLFLSVDIDSRVMTIMIMMLQITIGENRNKTAWSIDVHIIREVCLLVFRCGASVFIVEAPIYFALPGA